MKKIQPNSFEAVALFVMYICNQDGQISNAKIKEFWTISILKRLYFDVFGEFIYEDFLDDLDAIIDEVKAHNFNDAKVSKQEREFISKLINDPKLCDICLLEAKRRPLLTCCIAKRNTNLPTGIKPGLIRMKFRQMLMIVHPE